MYNRVEFIVNIREVKLIDLNFEHIYLIVLTLVTFELMCYFNLVLYQAQQCDNTYKGRCDFSHGICDFWTNDMDDNFDWTLTKGSTPTAGTGPSTDHTTRTDNGNVLLGLLA